MNVLIADDEPVIRLGLRTLVDWERHGLTLIGEAADGEEAWALIEEHQVDILVTDILMPRMDGLELIRRVKEAGRDIGILVLSCLDDFKYVKEAMKHGAKDYLLKPTMEPEELVRVLTSIRREVEEARAVQSELKDLQEKVAKTSQEKLEAEFQRYLDTGVGEDFAESGFFGGKNPGVWTSLLLHRISLPSAEECGLPEGLPLRVPWKGQQSFLLFYPIEGRQSGNLQLQEGFHRASLWHRKLEQTGGLQEGGFIGIGPRIDSLEQLKGAVSRHERQIHEHYYNGDRKILEEVPQMIVAAENFALLQETRNRLLRAIGSGNPDGMNESVRELVERIHQARLQPDKLQTFVQELIAMASGYARDNGYVHMDDYEQQFANLHIIRSFPDAAGLCAWLTQAVQELWGHRWAAISESAMRNPFIRRSVEFMRENYSRGIDTSDIAGHVKLNRSYLSDLYRRETGESLSESLLRIRMEEAKARLRSGGLKVYEVAEAVGFSDAKAFAKVFKKIVGCTPKEYGEGVPSVGTAD